MSDTDRSELATQYRDIGDVADALGLSGRVVEIEMNGPQVAFRTEVDRDV